MARIVFLGMMLAYAALAFAQTYRWVDKDGRVHYTATPPPPGTEARTIATPSRSSAPAAPADAKGEENKGPLTPAEQEQAFQKRRLEAEKAAEKAAAAAKEESVKAENCRRARELLATLQSGQRVRRTNEKGEQYYVDDDARASETQAAQRSVQEWCN